MGASSPGGSSVDGHLGCELHHLGGALDSRNLRACPIAGQELDHGLADPIEIGTELLQDLGRDALALADQSEQDVLGSDVVVTELQRFSQRELEDLLRSGRERDVAAGDLRSPADDLADVQPNCLERDAEARERPGGHPFFLA